MPKIRRIAAPLILCPHRLRIKNGILTFQDNKLVDISAASPSELDSSASVEYYNGIIIPAWTNAHCHLELSYMHGRIAENQNLDGFIRSLNTIREQTCVMDRISAMSFRQSQMFAEGVVLVADICNDTFGLSLKRESGIEYVNFIELYGLGQSHDKVWMHGIDVMDLCDELGLKSTIVPHSTYSVSESLMSKIASSHQELPISIHFMEDPAELELFNKSGALYDRYLSNGLEPDFIAEKTPAHRLINNFSKEQPLLLVHNTFVREEDIDLINDYFDSVCWVLSPRSNYYISRSEPPYELLMRKGCQIALGTDSLASNSTLSVCDEVKFIHQKHPEISLDELIYWATLSGRKMLTQFKGEFSPEQMFDYGAVLIEDVDLLEEKLLPQSQSRRLI